MNQEDQDGFREFVASRLVPLRKLAYVTCGDWHTAEDAVANALAKLYPRWRRVDRPDLYVQTLVFRAAIDEMRRPWRREHSASDSLPDMHEADTSGATDERLRIRAALLAVPPKQRTVLVLRYYAGLTVEETAEVLGTQPETVKSHTARGLARLRTTLARSHPTPLRAPSL